MFSKSNNVDIEKVCREIFDEVSILVENKIANKALASLNEKEYEQGYMAYNEKLNGYKAQSAKAAGVLTIIVFIAIGLSLKNIMLDSNNEDTSNPANYLFLIIFGIFFIKLHELKFGSIPLSHIGTKFFLKEEQKNLCDLNERANITIMQADSLSPYQIKSFFSNFNNTFRSNPLLGLSELEHDAIARGLLGLKNDAFDCVATSTLTVLSSLEKRIPFSIRRVMSHKNSIRNHHFPVINLSYGSHLKQIHTWNDDAFIIDVWYGICISAKNIKNTPLFFDKYPLLNLKDKVYHTIQIDDAKKAYESALILFKTLREKNLNKREGQNHSPSYLEIFFPKFK